MLPEILKMTPKNKNKFGDQKTPQIFWWPKKGGHFSKIFACGANFSKNFVSTGGPPPPKIMQLVALATNCIDKTHGDHP